MKSYIIFAFVLALLGYVSCHQHEDLLVSEYFTDITTKLSQDKMRNGRNRINMVSLTIGPTQDFG